MQIACSCWIVYLNFKYFWICEIISGYNTLLSQNKFFFLILPLLHRLFPRGKSSLLAGRILKARPGWRSSQAPGYYRSWNIISRKIGLKFEFSVSKASFSIQTYVWNMFDPCTFLFLGCEGIWNKHKGRVNKNLQKFGYITNRKRFNLNKEGIKRSEI